MDVLSSFAAIALAGVRVTRSLSELAHIPIAYAHVGRWLH